MDGAERPVSPHLQVYRWQLNMLLSSVHRITGLLLSLGAVVLAVWLLAVAGGSESYRGVAAVTASAWFKLPLVGWSFCFFFHLANGVRHLVWDTTYGFERAQIAASGRFVVAVSVVLTALSAFVIFF
jgi:succinate dehydrogenase / fumarate reductase cytochrome b subunit